LCRVIALGPKHGRSVAHHGPKAFGGPAQTSLLDEPNELALERRRADDGGDLASRRSEDTTAKTARSRLNETSTGVRFTFVSLEFDIECREV
jgi:hypothetical protein